MIGLIGNVADKRLRFVAADKQTQSALKAALRSEMPIGLNWDQKYVAAEPLQFSSAFAFAQTNGATPLLVLEGPTPLAAKQVPASLVVLPVRELEFSGDVTVQQLAASVFRMLNAEEAMSDNSCQNLEFESVSPISCKDAGEPETITEGTQALEVLWAGDTNQGGTDHFWHFLQQTCVENGGSPKRLCDLILSRYCVWFSPYSGVPIDPVEAIGILETVRENWQRNERSSHCYGAQYWNHPAINATFSGKHGSVRFHDTQEGAVGAAKEDGGQILSWAGRTDAAFEDLCKTSNIPLLRIEDGFLRSVGLGAGLARGAMLAVDDLGIYYDPSRPSRLEALLNDYELSDAEQRRGESLIELIKTARVSKYNFGNSKKFSFPSGRTKVLVPGQVADDAAIRKSRSNTIDCANTPNVNLDLLKLARARNPEAYLVFKPHPDVETGLRKGKLERNTALEFADEVAEGANIIDLIEEIDVVETFSSLSGFEALLRGKKVIVHGAPFYAGWGLTEDLTEIETRKKRRLLSELVYLALVKYARTIDPVSLVPCTPEFLVSRLVEQRTDKTHLLVTAIKRHSSWLGRKLGI